MNILENKGNMIIIKENNFLKLFSFKSLVCIYDTEKKQFEEVPYTFINIYGTSSSYSKTTTRHLNKFKKFITSNYQIRSVKNAKK